MSCLSKLMHMKGGVPKGQKVLYKNSLKKSIMVNI